MTGDILKIRDKDGNFVGVPAIVGAPGKSAYESALEGGFKGTEEEFNQAIAELSPNTEHTENKNNPHEVTAEQVGAIPEAYYLSTDLDTEIRQGGNKMTVCYYNSATLHSPRSEGLTAYAHGMIITNAHTEQYGVQLCMPSGDGAMYIRRLDKQGITGWSKLCAEKYAYDGITAVSNTRVNKAGDTMTGALTIDKDTDWGQLIMHSGGAYRSFEADDKRIRLDVRDTTETNNRRFVDIFSNTADSRISHAFRFSQQKEGETSVTAYMLHDHNINNFVVSKGSYTGADTTSKTIPIRSTTQMVIVYGANTSAGTSATLAVLVRGMNKAHYNISPYGDESTQADLVWTDTSVTIKAENMQPAYSQNWSLFTYSYVLVG